MADNRFEAVRGTVFNIQRYNMHDGDGIRTIVFLKGCGLRCKWCANPEGMLATPQLRLQSAKCVGCGACASVCESGACRFSEGAAAMRWDVCTSCGRCAAVCAAGAREIVGRSMRVEEVMDEVRRDFHFFRRSGGGLTLSGGEALLQRDFACALLQRAHDEGMHTAIETCGCVPWSAFEAVRAHVDLFFFDLKHMNPDAHRALTGRDNAQILENARRLAASGARIVFRTPVIPDLNDSEQNIAETARFVADIGKRELELLPYHQYGMGKYAQLGLEYTLAQIAPPEEEHMRKLRSIVERVLCGGGVSA